MTEKTKKEKFKEWKNNLRSTIPIQKREEPKGIIGLSTGMSLYVTDDPEAKDKSKEKLRLSIERRGAVPDINADPAIFDICVGFFDEYSVDYFDFAIDRIRRALLIEFSATTDALRADLFPEEGRPKYTNCPPDAPLEDRLAGDIAEGRFPRLIEEIEEHFGLHLKQHKDYLIKEGKSIDDAIESDFAIRMSKILDSAKELKKTIKEEWTDYLVDNKED